MIKKYRISAIWQECHVTLEVDHSKLTPDMATAINEFWSGDDERLDSEDGNAVLAVIRMFGLRAIEYFMGEGMGLNSHLTEAHAEHWTKCVINYQSEGWPDYENLGIKIIEGLVELPTYDDIELTEV